MSDYVTRAAVREMQAIRTAEAEVAPVVGAIAAMDSAASVYIEASKRLGVSAAHLLAVRGSAEGARAIFSLARQRGRPAVATDDVSADEFEAMFGPRPAHLHNGF